MCDFLNKYKSNKEIRDLIKHRVYNTQQRSKESSWNNHDLSFKITHIKSMDDYDDYNPPTSKPSISINVKVSGKIRGHSWICDKDGLSEICGGDYFGSNIRRNREIRSYVIQSLTKHLRLFGLDYWRLEVGKIKVVSSL